MILGCCATCCLIEATLQAQSSSTRSFRKFTVNLSYNRKRGEASRDQSIEARFAQTCSAERDSLGSSNEDEPSLELPSGFPKSIRIDWEPHLLLPLNTPPPYNEAERDSLGSSNEDEPYTQSAVKPA
jgi:hypothetical protein